MNDYDSGIMRGSEVDVEAAVRRGQRRFKVRLALMWVTVLAAAAVLVGAAVAVRAYVHSLAFSSRVSPVFPASASLLLLLAAGGAFLLLLLKAPVKARREGRRLQHVRFEPHISPGHVTVYQDRQTTPTISVRFIPRYVAGIVTVEEVAR